MKFFKFFWNFLNFFEIFLNFFKFFWNFWFIKTKIQCIQSYFSLKKHRMKNCIKNKAHLVYYLINYYLFVVRESAEWPELALVFDGTTTVYTRARTVLEVWLHRFSWNIIAPNSIFNQCENCITVFLKSKKINTILKEISKFP